MKKSNLSSTEAASLIEYLEVRQERHAMIIELLLRTGLRCHEVYELKVADLDLEQGILTLWRGAKGSNGRTWELPIGYVSRARSKVKESGLGGNDRLVDGLGYESKGGSDETFKSTLRRSWGIVRRRVFGASFKLSLHGLRHTYCEHFYQASGMDIRATQRAMGHKSLASTAAYLTSFDRDQHHKITRGLYEDR